MSKKTFECQILDTQEEIDVLIARIESELEGEKHHDSMLCNIIYSLREINHAIDKAFISIM